MYAVWPDGTYCDEEDISDYLTMMSDDYSMELFPPDMSWSEIIEHTRKDVEEAETDNQVEMIHAWFSSYFPSMNDETVINLLSPDSEIKVCWYPTTKQLVLTEVLTNDWTIESYTLGGEE